MIVRHLSAILLVSVLTVACQHKTATGIRGTITHIHYVTWDQANDKPDTVFIRLDNATEFRLEVVERLPLQTGQLVLVQPAVQTPSQTSRVQTACGITPLDDRGKPLTTSSLRPVPHCN